MIPVNNIMLVDDNKIDLFVNQRVIENYNSKIRVIPFQNPLSALEYLKISMHENNLNPFTRPNVLFLDINMPQCNGFEFLDAISKMEALQIQHLKIYMLSSSVNPKDIKNTQINPLCAGYVSKPLTVEKLQGIINTNNIVKSKQVNLKKDSSA